MTDWLSTTEAGKLIGMGREFVVELCEDGAFPNAWRKPGSRWRIPRSDVEAYLERMRAMVQRRKKR